LHGSDAAVQTSQSFNADKAYSSAHIRKAAKERGILANIPNKVYAGVIYDFDKELYRNRNVIERRIGWPKEY